jgi:ABC-2 type transport system ATP-binding protein
VLDQFTATAFAVTSPDITDDLLGTIRERFEVVDVTSVERGRRVEVATDSDGFYRLLALCRDHDVTLTGVGTVEPGLEDVFVEITGRER